MNEVRRTKLHQERGNDIGEKDEPLGDVGPDEIEGGGEDDHVEDVVDETYNNNNNNIVCQ